ncbi:unnamed protein product, partial [marine sediment metagenome]
AKHKGLGPIPLMSPEKAKDWTPPPENPKKLGSYTFNEPDEVMKWRR